MPVMVAVFSSSDARSKAKTLEDARQSADQVSEVTSMASAESWLKRAMDDMIGWLHWFNKDNGEPIKYSQVKILLES